MDLQLQRKRVLITGSSRGIGYAIAERFLQEGARVCITGRTETDLVSARTRLESRFPQSEIVKMVCDFTDKSSVAHACSLMSQEWKGLDVLVSNVGSGTSVMAPIPDEKEFERMMNINFFCCVATIRSFLNMLGASGGVVIAVSSIAGIEAISAPSAYTVSKASLNAFVKGLSRQFASTQVRINAVAPGNILCENGSWAKKLASDSDATMQYINANVPTQRFGKPEEIASIVAFLSSPLASFINGATIVADGGQTVGIS